MKTTLFIVIPICLALVYFTTGKSEPAKHGTITHMNPDGTTSFTEVYGTQGDLQEKTVYYKTGQVMLHINLRDGKETLHEFFPEKVTVAH
jgi:hypothetical protein